MKEIKFCYPYTANVISEMLYVRRMFGTAFYQHTDPPKPIICGPQECHAEFVAYEVDPTATGAYFWFLYLKLGDGLLDGVDPACRLIIPQGYANCDIVSGELHGEPTRRKASERARSLMRGRVERAARLLENPTRMRTPTLGERIMHWPWHPFR